MRSAAPSRRPLQTAPILALALLAAGVTSGAPDSKPAGAAPAHVTRFQLVSHGLTVGQGRIIRASAVRNGQPCLETRVVTEAKVNVPFYKYSLNMDERWVTDPSGLIAYHLNQTENGRPKTISGGLSNGVFQCDITEDGQHRVWATPRAAFEWASNSQPGQALAEGETSQAAVLDPAAGAITERVYRGTGRERLTVGQQQVLCHTLTIEGPGTHIRRWWISDEFGPLILREEGREPRGTYSRRAVSMALEMKPAE